MPLTQLSKAPPGSLEPFLFLLRESGLGSPQSLPEILEKRSELEQLKEQLKAKDSSLQRIESNRLKLTEKLQASQEELKTVIKERDGLERVQEALQK